MAGAGVKPVSAIGFFRASREAERRPFALGPTPPNA